MMPVHSLSETSLWCCLSTASTPMKSQREKGKGGKHLLSASIEESDELGSAFVRRGFLLFFVLLLRGEFFGHGFLKLFRIHAIAFGGVHENVVAAGGGSLISRIQQADFEKKLAEFGLVVGAHSLDEKVLSGRRVFLHLYLVPLRQSRDLAVGEMANQVVSDRQQVSLL